jgi:hypothetical protein
MLSLAYSTTFKSPILIKHAHKRGIETCSVLKMKLSHIHRVPAISTKICFHHKIYKFCELMLVQRVKRVFSGFDYRELICIQQIWISELIKIHTGVKNIYLL